MPILFFFFRGAAMPSSTVAVPFCTPPNSAWESVPVVLPLREHLLILFFFIVGTLKGVRCYLIHSFDRYFPKD